MAIRPPIALPRPPLGALALITLAAGVMAAAPQQARRSRLPMARPRDQQHSSPPAAPTAPARTATPVPPGRRPYGTGRGPGSHLCPAAGCRQPISPGRLMCRPHWYQVPKPLRDTVWATWRSGAGTGTSAHTSAVLAAISAATATSPPGQCR